MVYAETVTHIHVLLYTYTSGDDLPIAKSSNTLDTFGGADRLPAFEEVVENYSLNVKERDEGREGGREGEREGGRKGGR